MLDTLHQARRKPQRRDERPASSRDTWRYDARQAAPESSGLTKAGTIKDLCRQSIRPVLNPIQPSWDDAFSFAVEGRESDVMGTVRLGWTKVQTAHGQHDEHVSIDPGLTGQVSHHKSTTTSAPIAIRTSQSHRWMHDRETPDAIPAARAEADARADNFWKGGFPVLFFCWNRDQRTPIAK